MGKKTAGKVIAATALGVGIGMLLAPKSGKETREDLKSYTKKTANKIKDIDLNEVKDELINQYEKLKDELADMDAEKAKKIAKKKVDELTTKANELMDMAKEKSSPVIEKSAKDIKKKLYDLLENVQDKLDD